MPCGQAEASLNIRGPDGERDMRCSCCCQDDCADRVGPRREKENPRCIRGFDRDHGKGMIKQMGNDIDEHRQPGRQMYASSAKGHSVLNLSLML